MWSHTYIVPPAFKALCSIYNRDHIILIFTADITVNTWKAHSCIHEGNYFKGNATESERLIHYFNLESAHRFKWGIKQVLRYSRFHRTNKRAHTHTHTHTYIYIYIYIFSTSHEPHEAIFHSFIHERTKHSVRHDSRSCCCVGGNVAYCTVIVMHIYIYMILFCDICKKTCNISVIQNVYSSVQYLHHTRLLQTAGWLMLLIPKFTYIVTNQRELSERNQ